MSDLWVVNASPLIVLGKIDQLDLLHRLSQKVVVPNAVAEEIKVGPENDPARAASEPTPELAAWDLGLGETAVLSYALENPDWTAILDDAAARKCAISFDIKVKGTLAIVILAKKRGLIPSAKQTLHTMQETGLRLDEKTIRQVLKDAVGEDW